MKIIKTTFVILLLFLLTFTVYAHSGRTDSHGGHWDHSTGTYHYHSGEYAGRSSSGSSSTTTDDNFIPPDTPTPSPKISSAKKNSTSSEIYASTSKKRTFGDYVAFVFAILFLGGWLVVWVLCALVISLVKNCTPTLKLKAYRQAFDNYDKASGEASSIQLKIALINLEAPIPDEYEVGKDGLPREKGADGWGSTFTLYKSNSGKKLHAEKGCCGATNKVHALSVLWEIQHGNRLCKKCAASYSIPDTAWYYAHKKRLKLEEELVPLLENQRKKYNIFLRQNEKCNTRISRCLINVRKKNREELKLLNSHSEIAMFRQKRIDDPTSWKDKPFSPHPEVTVFKNK